LFLVDCPKTTEPALLITVQFSKNSWKIFKEIYPDKALHIIKKFTFIMMLLLAAVILTTLII